MELGYYVKGTKRHIKLALDRSGDQHRSESRSGKRKVTAVGGIRGDQVRKLGSRKIGIDPTLKKILQQVRNNLRQVILGP